MADYDKDCNGLKPKGCLCQKCCEEYSQNKENKKMEKTELTKEQKELLNSGVKLLDSVIPKEICKNTKKKNHFNQIFEMSWKKTLSDGRLQPNILEEFKGQSWIKELCRAITIQAIKEEINYKNYLSENHKNILKHEIIKENEI